MSPLLMSKDSGISSKVSFTLRVFLLSAAGVFMFLCLEMLGSPETRRWFNPAFLREWFFVGEAMQRTHSRYLYAEKTGFDKLSAGALFGITHDLDEYSEYMPPSEFDAFRDEIEQRLTGIGVLLDTVDGFPVILRSYETSGAEAAGLRPGDFITEINGNDTQGKRVAETAALMKGKAGSKVRIGFSRAEIAGGATQYVDVERRTIFIPCVSETRMLEKQIGYIRLLKFERRTAEELSGALHRLKKNGATRFIIDLRDNPGGTVSSAIDTVGLFCKKGTLVASAQGRNAQDAREYKTELDPEFPDIRPVILVNKDSASAAELVSGAMQDLRLAVVVGEQTFGKGVVQSVFDLGDDRALKLTTARYMLPCGRSIHKTGVRPDIAQPLSQRDRLLLNIAENRQAAGLGETCRPRFGKFPEDTQLAAACDFLNATPAAKTSAP